MCSKAERWKWAAAPSKNADVLVKSGGTLKIKNNGGIHLNRYGKLDAEKGATVNALYGEVQTAR